MTGEREGTGEHTGEFGLRVSVRQLSAGVVIPLFRGGEGEPDPPDSRQDIPKHLFVLVMVF